MAKWNIDNLVIGKKTESKNNKGKSRSVPNHTQKNTDIGFPRINDESLDDYEFKRIDDDSLDGDTILAPVKDEETSIRKAGVSISEGIENLKNKSLQIKAKTISDHDDIRNIPALTPQDIEDAINAHKDQNKYPYKFKIGGKIGRGGFSNVYKLLYVDEKGSADYSSMKKNYVVKVLDPIHSFLRTNYDYLQAEDDHSLEHLKQNLFFQNFLHQRNEALGRITLLSKNQLEKANVVKYYPELSFNIDLPVPMVTVIVMEEAVCTLKDFSTSVDIDSRIKRMFKVGSEIGRALQACEYPDDEKQRFNHRDVKPFNIGVRFTGDAPDYFEYILIDCESGRVVYEQDKTNTNVFSIKFAAPELINGNKLNDDEYRLADQYSFGAVLAYILHPENWKDYKKELVDHSYIPSVIDTCLQLNPKDRYKSFQELIDHLNDAKKTYFSTNSGDAVSEEEINRIKDMYEVLLSEKDEVYSKAKTDYEDLLKEKDELIAVTKKELEESPDPNEFKRLEKRNIVLNTLYNNLCQDIEKYIKVFEKKEAKKDNARVVEKIIEGAGRTVKYKYSYTELSKGYERKTYDPNSNWVYTEKYNNNNQLCIKTTTAEDRGHKDCSLSIWTSIFLYNNMSGEYIEQCGIDKDELIDLKLYSETGQRLCSVKRKYFHINSNEKITFELEPGFEEDKPIAINLLVNDVRRPTPAYIYTYIYWPDGSIRSKKMISRDSDLLDYDYDKIMYTYTINGLLDSERCCKGSANELYTKYFYDHEGKCIHEDVYKNGHLDHSILKTYDADGRMNMSIKYDGLSSIIEKTAYIYESE